MAKKEQYLDYDGLKTYHNTLVEKLKDLEYDPSRMFADKIALLTLNNWNHDEYNRIFGLKAGLVVTVGKQIWQLVNPETFYDKITEMGKTPAQKSELYSVTQLGWKIVGSTVDFNINNHVLELSK